MALLSSFHNSYIHLKFSTKGIMKIIVLLGAASPERNISIQSGKGIARALKELGHQVICLDPALNESFDFNESKIDSLLEKRFINEGNPNSIEVLFKSLLNIKNTMKPDIVF